MEKDWRFVSEETEYISLHDHQITSVEESGGDLVLFFQSDGFDVAAGHPLNPTGRHRNTGPAAVVLKNGRFQEGAFGRGCEEVIRLEGGTEHRVPLEEVPITREQFLYGLELEVLDFSWDQKKLTLFADAGTREPASRSTGFCEVVLRCDRVLFCWDGLPEDAWFQEK